MFHVISYDIPDDKRRLKVAKVLLDFGSRVQYSVFEAFLDDTLLEKLRDRLEKIIFPKEDRLRIYRMCKDCEKGIEVMGLGEPPEDPDVYIV